MANNINIIRQQSPENVLNNSEMLQENLPIDDAGNEILGVEKVGFADKESIVLGNLSVEEKTYQQSSASYPKTVFTNQDVIVNVEDAPQVKTQLAEEVVKTSGAVASSGLKPMHLLFGLLGASAVGAAAGGGGGGGSESGSAKQDKTVETTVVEAKKNTNISSSQTSITLSPVNSVSADEQVLAVNAKDVEKDVSESVLVEKAKAEAASSSLEAGKSPAPQNNAAKPVVNETVDKSVGEQQEVVVSKVAQSTVGVTQNKEIPTSTLSPVKSASAGEQVLAVNAKNVEKNISEPVLVEKAKVEAVSSSLEAEKSPASQNNAAQPAVETIQNQPLPVESKTTGIVKENVAANEAVAIDANPLQTTTPMPVEFANLKTDTASVGSENLVTAKDVSLQTSGNNISDGLATIEKTDTAVFGVIGGYKVYTHTSYGKYVDARDFGSDPSGKQDSYAAIKAALAAAHQVGAGVYLHGKLYISEQLVIDKNTSGVTSLFGDGMGKTVISFDKAQVGVFNPNSNDTDIRKDAGILIDGQNGKTIADLSVQYTNKDFYRPGESYFGKVCGILVNDASNTLISKVEVSGANRAGIMFSSTAALTVDPNGKGKTYKARLIHDEISEDYPNLPVGENNRLVDSYLHHNRVAGAGVAYQKDFIAEGNTFSWNGHEADGGTGYGIMAMAGSYNFGVTFTKNTTDHNYRKGLDVHDGNDIVITDNVAIGDRLYGIAVYNRQFTMNNVKISGNVIEQDPNFRLEADDNLQYKNSYHTYSGIQIQTNTQLKNLHSDPNGYFEISNNTIKNLTLYKDAVQTYAIEFRNHEQAMDYTLNIKDNHISGESTKYLIGIINNTKDYITQTNGPGSGNINITGNIASIGEIARTTMPIFINEHNTDGNLRGAVTIQDNYITVREKSNGAVEGIQVIGNATQYNIIDNVFELHGVINHSIISIHGHRGEVQPELNVTGNLVFTDYNQLSNQWIESVRATVNASDNKHNDAEALAEKLAAKNQTTSEENVVEVADESIGEDIISGPLSVTETANTQLFDIGSDSVGDNDSARAQPAGVLSDTVITENGSALTLSDLLDTGNTIELASLLPSGNTSAALQPGTTDAAYLPTLPVTEISYTEDIGNTVIF
ncbi:right-handed parallel beta-helix repeat-containing protein [Neisseria sp. S1]|uniref:right-handed parallel beta-helix repeat-containing protein n=1 Tax=Neisseria sp. S1 TaxID=3318354 RepID=UPI003A837414